MNGNCNDWPLMVSSHSLDRLCYLRRRSVGGVSERAGPNEHAHLNRVDAQTPQLVRVAAREEAHQFLDLARRDARRAQNVHEPEREGGWRVRVCEQTRVKHTTK